MSFEPLRPTPLEPVDATPATIRIPAPLRDVTGGADSLPVHAATVGDALDALFESYPALRERVVDADGRPRGFVNIFLGDRDVTRLDGLATPLGPAAVISILPAVAGGRR